MSEFWLVSHDLKTKTKQIVFESRWEYTLNMNESVECFSFIHKKCLIVQFRDKHNTAQLDLIPAVVGGKLTSCDLSAAIR